MVEFDPASFKDPDGRVFRTPSAEGRVFRTLSTEGRETFRALETSGLLRDLVEAGRVVETSIVRSTDAGAAAAEVGEEVLSHVEVPALSYAFEWPFGMLRDAALLTLDVHLAALDRGFALKDATPYNVQFLDGRPVLIDVPSIAPYRDGAPWEGYAQFCSSFLFPLLLAAHRGIDHRPLLRGRLAGIAVGEAARLLGAGSMFRPGVLTHVLLQSWLERRFSGARLDLRREFTPASFPKAAVVAQARRLRALVSGLRRRGESAWLSYDEDGEAPYREAKDRFVRAAVEAERPKAVLDLGTNTGRYARIAAETAERVVAVDSDPACVDRLWAEVRAGRAPRRILPLAVDLVDPSPALGWDLRERSAWRDRIRGDFFLALALVHHVSIAGNVPLEAVCGQLRALAPRGVVEFVHADDPMARLLLQHRKDPVPGYARDRFERALEARFSVVAREEMPGATRTLYRVSARS